MEKTVRLRPGRQGLPRYTAALMLSGVLLTACEIDLFPYEYYRGLSDDGTPIRYRDYAESADSDVKQQVEMPDGTWVDCGNIGCAATFDRVKDRHPPKEDRDSEGGGGGGGGGGHSD